MKNSHNAIKRRMASAGVAAAVLARPGFLAMPPARHGHRAGRVLIPAAENSRPWMIIP
jgi:hypothetical protein